MRGERGEKIILASSGGFDPLHIGHIRMFNEAKEMGGHHIVILNNDNWLRAKKGFAFMNEEERRELLLSLESVDEVIISKHEENPEDMSVSRDLAELRPHIFVNGGDRKKHNTPEDVICSQLNIKTIFNVGHGGKVQSSSNLLEKYKNNTGAV